MLWKSWNYKKKDRSCESSKTTAKIWENDLSQKETSENNFLKKQFNNLVRYSPILKIILSLKRKNVLRIRLLVFIKAVIEKVVSSRKTATMVTARKTIFSSFKCSEKMVFPKKSHWNMIFLIVLSGQVIFLFPENMIFFFRRKKMKDDLSQKYTWKYDIFFKCPEKMVFPIKIALEYDLSWLRGKMVFFSLKYDIFSLVGKWKMIFLKKYVEIWYFLYIFSRKDTLKGD